MSIRPLVSVLAIAGLAAATLAHGGMYRGPFSGGPGGPRTPGPLTPGSGLQGPVTGTRSVDPACWQAWWEFNKDPYLRLREARGGGSVPGSDDFFFGAHRPAAAGELATDADRTLRIYPALTKALPLDSGSDLVTACLIAMAKLAATCPELDPTAACLQLLPRGDQEIRETAALSLGLSRRITNLKTLRSLALDDADGRKLMQRNSVDDRTRAFALYGLGLLGQRAPETTTRDNILVILEQVLRDPTITSADIKVAAVHAGKLLQPSGSSSAERRLVLRSCEILWAYYRQNLGKSEQVSQAHAPSAIARLLGRGTGSDHQRFKKALADELVDNSRHLTIRQSAALALGVMALPREAEPSEARWSEALDTFRTTSTDQQGRSFALIALAMIGGEHNRQLLLQAFENAKGLERGWSALALGVLVAHATPRDNDVTSRDLEVGALLLRGIDRTQNPDHRAAIAIALGLCRHQEAVNRLITLLGEHKSDDEFAGYLCVGLALLGDKRAVPPIRALVAASPRRPELLKQAATALGKLQDTQATELLLSLLRDDSSPFLAKLGAVAGALGLIGDRRSIAPLVKMLGDPSLGKVTRAFVAAALGGIGDAADMPWNAAIAIDTNYRAWVETLTNQSTGVLDIL